VGLLSWTVGLPFLPVRGVVRLAEVIQKQVDEQMHSPATLRRELEQIDEMARRGEITREEELEMQRQLTRRMVGPTSPGVG